MTQFRDALSARASGDALVGHVVQKYQIAEAQARAAIGFLINQAKSSAGTNDLFDVIFQHGAIGFLVAAQKFNPNLQVPFEAFAQKYIRAWILRSFRQLPDQQQVPTSEAGDAVFDFEDAEALPVDDQLLADEFIGAVHEFVAGLPLNLQRVAQSVILQSRSQAEASRELGLSKTAVGKIMAEVRRRAMRSLSAYLPPWIAS